MKIFPSLMIFLLPFSPSENLTSTALLHKMYDRYHGKWQTNLSFNQTTEQYQNDKLVKTNIWYEHILYPETQRIDIDSVTSGNSYIEIKDSLYVIRHNKLVQTVKNDDGIIFFLGGLYFMPFDDVLNRFNSLNYNLNKFHAETWKGREVYIIGAGSSDEKVNQLWIDKEQLVVVRFIKYDAHTKEDVQFEKQVPLKGGWSETRCTAYINDHLIQVETYHDIIADGPVDKKMFDPSLIGK